MPAYLPVNSPKDSGIIAATDLRRRFPPAKAKANVALKTLPWWTHERERNLSVVADAIKAMAYQAVGQKTQAGETFRAAAEFADAEFPAMDGGNMGGDWKDMLAARTLLEEAQTWIGVSAGPR